FVILLWLKLFSINRAMILKRHHFLILCVIFQFVVGIILVSFSIPNDYAIIHHIGALALITSAIYSFHGEFYEEKR
ncbi:MAG: hypothetical protein CFH01_01238, partial [Alphaproteobacteria bacterium MarineAlpha2_Bin1]